MDYFENEQDAVQIDGLSIENRVDGISFYGNLTIGKDKVGLANARLLLEMFEDLVLVLQVDEKDLPDKIEYVNNAVDVDNPFESK